MLKIAAFDLDGTIADTMPLSIEAFCESVSGYMDHELTEKEVVETFGLNETGMVNAIVRENRESAMRDFYERYEILHREVTEPFPGILELFAFLREKNVMLALITGKGERSCCGNILFPKRSSVISGTRLGISKPAAGRA